MPFFSVVLRSSWWISGTMTLPTETRSWRWVSYGPSSSTSRSPILSVLSSHTIYLLLLGSKSVWSVTSFWVNHWFYLFFGCLGSFWFYTFQSNINRVNHFASNQYLPQTISFNQECPLWSNHNSFICVNEAGFFCLFFFRWVSQAPWGIESLWSNLIS